MKPQAPANSIAPLIAESERLLGAAIAHFGLTIKPEQIITTIQSRGRKQALGWFGPDHWRNGKPGGIHEINLCAEALKTHHMGETLLHELAHAENKARGIQDCDKTGRVHNKHFKTMAESLGLVVMPRDKKYGFGYTDLAQAGIAFLEKIAFKRELFDLARLEFGASAPTGSRLIKCECPDCGYTARITRKWLDVGMPTFPCGHELELAS